MSSRPAQARATRQRSASASARAAQAARRRRAARRRKTFLWLAGVAAIGITAILVAPLFHSAVQDFRLPLNHDDVIRQQAADKHLDPALIAGVIYAESKFNDDEESSSAGALGLMQLLPGTAHFIAGKTGGSAFTTADLATPRINIAYGSWYLRYLMDEYENNEVLALAAYNGGETNVNRWVAAAHEDGRAFEVDDIPFPETRAYVQRVMAAQQDYRRTYGQRLGIH